MQPDIVPLVPEKYPPLPPQVVEPVQHLVRPRVRRKKFRSTEYIYFIEAMHSIFPIGPTEWKQVLELHSVQFQGRDTNTLRRKYTTLHRKMKPTGNPNMPDEVRMAKSCKSDIA